MVQDGRRLVYRRDGNAFFVTPGSRQSKGALKTVTVYYHGRPRVAVRPPWDGGLIWARDPDGGSWISTACQGLGASVWWPNKDTQADEPDSQRVALTVPDSLTAVGNGRLRGIERGADGWSTWEWFVTNPINNYDVAPYVGRYAQFSDAFEGEAGHLTLDFWPLAAHLDAARERWRQVKPFKAFRGPLVLGPPEIACGKVVPAEPAACGDQTQFYNYTGQGKWKVATGWLEAARGEVGTRPVGGPRKSRAYRRLLGD